MPTLVSRNGMPMLSFDGSSDALTLPNGLRPIFLVMNSSPTDTMTPSPQGSLLAGAGLPGDVLFSAGFRAAGLASGFFACVSVAGGDGWVCVDAGVEMHDRAIAAANNRSIKVNAGMAGREEAN